MAAVGLDVTFRPLEDDEEPSLAFDGLKEMSVQTNTSSHIHCWCDGVETDILLSQLVAFRYKALLGFLVSYHEAKKPTFGPGFTWLVLGEDPAARSHRVQQFTAL